MNSILNRKIIANFSTVFLTFVCGLDWAYIDVISLYLIWAIQFCYLAVAFTSYDANSLEIKDRRLLNFYFLWVFLSTILYPWKLLDMEKLVSRFFCGTPTCIDLYILAT